jgi:hypothetical protein
MFTSPMPLSFSRSRCAAPTSLSSLTDSTTSLFPIPLAVMDTLRTTERGGITELNAENAELKNEDLKERVLYCRVENEDMKRLKKKRDQD